MIYHSLIFKFNNNANVRKITHKALNNLFMSYLSFISISLRLQILHNSSLMFAFDMESEERVARVVKRCLEYGVISFWFLSHPYSFRLSPPLNITEAEIREAGEIIVRSIRETKE